MERFDDAPGAVKGDRDDIYADEAVAVLRVGVNEGGDGMKNPFRLDADDRFRRCAVPRRRADAHLDAEEYIAIKGDEIEFAAATMPVPRDDPGTGLFEQKSGDPFATRPDRRVARGWLCYRAAMPVMPIDGSTTSSADSNG